MFFYTSLFMASFIIAMVVLWLYKSLVGIGTALYRAILPSSKSNITDHFTEPTLPLTVNGARTPWGWSGHATPATEARTHVALPDKKAPEVPWGWPGNKHKVAPEYQVKEGIPLCPVTGARSGTRSNADITPPKAVRARAKKIGWPYREDQFEFAGDTYSVTQKVNPKKTNLKNTAKPWGW